MNKIISCLLAICTCAPAWSQHCSLENGVAYERATIPATMPKKTLDESGKEIERPVKKMSTYFIYIESTPNCSIYPDRIWIGSKAYSINLEEIYSPVIIQYSYPGKQPDTLVKATGNKVFRIYPKEELQVKADKKISKKLQSSKMIIEYDGVSGKKFFLIKEIKRLSPLVLQ
jgi:hypothetical protein